MKPVFMQTQGQQDVVIGRDAITQGAKTLGGQMVSSAYGPGAGGYGAYPPKPMSANEKKYSQVDQTVGGASKTFREAMSSTSPQAKQAQGSQPPAEEKGFFGKLKDKITNIF